MNRTEVTMDDLPELPFEQILSYLSVEDRLKSRAVSRGWRRKFDFKLKSLCCSEASTGFVWENARWVNGAFARNFIGSPRFASFLDTFGQSILSNLKRLRICWLDLNKKNATALVQTLNSFGELEELDHFSFFVRSKRSFYPGMRFELKLPMLTSIHFENVRGINTLVLDAPRLRKVGIVECSDMRLVIVRGESVERLLTDSENSKYIVKNLKNIQFLYSESPAVHSTFLSDLRQLKEIHLYRWQDISVLFEQKRRYGRTNLKIYFCGHLLNGPDDPAIGSLRHFNEEAFVQLAKNPSRLADEIPFYNTLDYSAFNGVDPEMAISLRNKFTRLYYITVDEVEDIERFLNFLKNSQIGILEFECDPPQELFDRLPEYLRLQKLTIRNAVPDLKSLFRLKHLIQLELPHCSIDAELIRKFFKEFPFLLYFQFDFNNKLVSIRNPEKWVHPSRFIVKFEHGLSKWADVPDLKAAIQLLVENAEE